MARWTSTATQDLKWAGYRFTGVAGTVFSIADEQKAAFAVDPGLTIAGLTWTNSFPSVPVTGQREWRADLGEWCYFDGTHWLGEPQTIVLSSGFVQTPTNPVLYTADQVDIYFFALPSYDILVTDVQASCLSTAPAPTTTNFHQLLLYDGGSIVHGILDYGLATGSWVRMIPNGTYPLPVILHASGLFGYMNLQHGGTFGAISVTQPLVTYRPIY